MLVPSWLGICIFNLMDSVEEKTKNQLRNQKRKEKKKAQKQASEELEKQVESEVKQLVKVDDEDFEVELVWCIKQLKLGLTQELSPEQSRRGD